MVPSSGVALVFHTAMRWVVDSFAVAVVVAIERLSEAKERGGERTNERSEGARAERTSES
jgi:hypothetical protein